jgi:hypothetical protein
VENEKRSNSNQILSEPNKQSSHQQINQLISYRKLDRLERILTMVYVVQNSQNFSGLFPSSCIPKKYDVSETGSVSVLR